MLKQAKRAGVVLAVAALSGCAVGIGPGNALSGSFEAPVAYQQAYQSAVDQAKLCLLGDGAYRTDGGLDSATRTGTMKVVSTLLNSQEMVRVQLTAEGSNRTRVQVAMWGKSIWDDKAMRAMHDAIYFTAPSCTAYMLPQTGTNPDAWFKQP
jgi:hypothetical protein